MNVDTAVNARGNYFLPIPMRVHPTLAVVGQLSSYSAGSIRNLSTTLAINPSYAQASVSAGFHTVCLFAVVGSGQTAGHASGLIANNAVSSLSFDAEL